MATQVKPTTLQISETELKGFGESLLRKALRRLSRDYLTMAAIIILSVMALLAILAPLITGYLLQVDHEATNPSQQFLPVGTPGHLLGTDNLGRDQLARLLHAGRISLGIGFFGAVITLGIGLALGVMTGYFGGKFDDALNWIITTLDSIPSLYLLILIFSVLSPSAESLVLVIALTGWTGTTRLIRGETLSRRNLDYILSAKAMGASPWRIMFAHIVPNLISVTAISLTTAIGGLILTESALSYLGVGVQPPTATWGNMLDEAQEYIRRGPHMIFEPGICIFVTVLCLYVIGDGLRDAFDPTTVE
jgi:peptide/nickel transport system permease protein